MTGEARGAVRELARLVADRARREAELTHDLEAALAAAHSAKATADAARAARAAGDRERIALGHADAVRLAHERFDVQTAAVQREATNRANEVSERAEVDAAAAKNRLEEAVWMAETLHESESPKPVQTFERLRIGVSGVLAQLAVIEQQAGALLAQWRMGAMPVVPEAGTRPNPETADVGLAELRLGADEAARAAERTLGRVVPRLFIVPLPEALALLGAAAGGVLGAWATGWRPNVGLAVGAGVLAGLGCGLWFLHHATRGVVQAEARGVAEKIARARACARGVLSTGADERNRTRAAVEACRDTTIAAARAAHAATMDDLRAARDRHRREAAAACDAALSEAARERDANVAAAEAARGEQTMALERWQGTQGEADVGAEVAATGGARAAFERAWSVLEKQWHDGTRSAAGSLACLSAEVEGQFPAWDRPPWTDLSANGEGDWPRVRACPRAIPLGVQRVNVAALPGGLSADARLALRVPPSLGVPVVLELPDRCSLLVQFGGGGGKPDPAVGAAREAALDVLRNASVRLLTGLPPGKVRFTFVDPVGLGQSFSAFMHLADYNEQLVGERIWTESRHIEARLADLTEHMENVIQKYLRNQFPTIEDYNVHAGEVAEPYRFVVLADVPVSLSENAAKRLASVIAAGPRCGVYTLIAQDLRHPLPAGLMQTDLDAATVRVAWRRGPDGTGRSVRTDADFAPWPLELERPPADAALNAVVRAAGRAAKDAGRVEVPFEMIAPGPDAVWTASTANELRIPIGRAGATKLQELVLGRGTAQHALIAGRTGSGKSTLLHALIVSGALWHSPDELEMYLVDFKKGVEFKTYATHHLPHARVVAVESEREFGLSVLRRLDAVLRARGDAFRACATQDVAAYRAARPGERMPRVLLVIDEFQELFVEDDKIAQESALLLDRLVRQGRAFGMHVVLGSQTLGGAYSLARSTIGQMGVRIALACNEADALLIMGDDNTAPRLLHRPGEAIYNDASGAVEANNPFQVAWLSDARRTEFLDLASAKAVKPAGAERELVVFEGSAPADLSNNRLLARAAAGRGGAAAISPLVWLGEPVAIKDPTGFALRKQSGANLLIVGQQDQTALAMGVSALVSLAAQGVRGADVSVLDGTPADAPADMQGVLEREGALRLPGMRLVRYREVGDALAELAAEVEKRVQGEGGPTKVLLIHGLQRYRVLRRPEDEFDFSSGGDEKAARPDRLLATILREGPGVGVHVICWCDTLASLNRALDRASVREFDGRVLMQISAADSSALIDSPVAGALGGNRAILFSEELGQIEKFRPYALPG